MKVILVKFIRLYQYLISPLIGYGKCRFYPSCSEYALEALRKKRFFKAIFLISLRIIKCNPWSRGGVDEVK